MLVLVLVFCCVLCSQAALASPTNVHVFHVQCLELVCLFQFLLIFAFVLLFVVSLRHAAR